MPCRSFNGRKPRVVYGGNIRPVPMFGQRLWPPTLSRKGTGRQGSIEANDGQDGANEKDAWYAWHAWRAWLALPTEESGVLGRLSVLFFARS